MTSSTYLPIARLDGLLDGVPAHAAADGIDESSCHVTDTEVLVDKTDLVEYRNMRPERAATSTYDRLVDVPHQADLVGVSYAGVER